MITLYLSHFAIDCLGSLAALYARQWCKHRWHQFLVWFILSIIVTVATVHAIG